MNKNPLLPYFLILLFAFFAMPATAFAQQEKLSLSLFQRPEALKPFSFDAPYEYYETELEYLKGAHNGGEKYEYKNAPKITLLENPAERAHLIFYDDQLAEVRIIFGTTYDDFEDLISELQEKYGQPSRNKKTFTMAHSLMWEDEQGVLEMEFDPTSNSSKVRVSKKETYNKKW